MTAIHVVSVKAKWTPWIITMNSHIIVSNKITQMRNVSSPLVLTVTIDIHLLNSVNIRSAYYWAFPLPHRVLHLFLTVFQCNLKKYYSNQKEIRSGMTSWSACRRMVDRSMQQSILTKISSFAALKFSKMAHNLGKTSDQNFIKMTRHSCQC